MANRDDGIPDLIVGGIKFTPEIVQRLRDDYAERLRSYPRELRKLSIEYTKTHETWKQICPEDYPAWRELDRIRRAQRMR